MFSTSPLKDKIALVAGATRGAGRGIACMLGEAGATVYCTGRSVKGQPASGAGRPETIDETAEMVTAHGGRGIAVQTDHSVPEQVQALVEKIEKEQGKLDILVNDIWGGDALTEWGKSFWEHDLQKGMLMQQRAVHTHLITAHYAAPLLLKSKNGLLVEVTDGDTLQYRGNLFYDLAKISTIRLGRSMAHELRHHGVTALTVTPGFLRSEAVLDHFGVTEDNWRDAVEKDPVMGSHFAFSETPYFIGRAIAALAADPQAWRKAGGVYASWTLMDEYGFTDIDGRRPHWGHHVRESIDQSWTAFTEALRDQFNKQGFPADDLLRTDRSTLKIKVSLPKVGKEPAWHSLQITEVELLLQDPAQFAEMLFSWCRDKL
jgi:NAD(P)-dependent dehydrogenase (short-subunit alcohol dehydrogenase family)